jgi:hypothetical protein
LAFCECTQLHVLLLYWLFDKKPFLDKCILYTDDGTNLLWSGSTEAIALKAIYLSFDMNIKTVSENLKDLQYKRSERAEK